MVGTPECRKGRVVCFLASFPECGGNSAPVSVDTLLLRWLSPRAELGSLPLPVCNSSRSGSDHCHPLTSLFLFAAALPFPCPFVPQPQPGGRTPARASAGTVHRESWPEICPAWPPPTAPLRAHPSAALIGCACPALNRQGPLTRGKFSVPGGSWTFGDSEKAAAPEAAGVWAAMEEPPLREEEEEEGDEAGPEGALGKSPFQLTAEDVYDISYVMGRELMALGSDPRVTQLQFKIVRVLEMLEALVNEGSLTVEELRMERDNLRKEVEGLRRESSAAGREELRDVLQERNKLKSQLLVVQEELQCYKSGLIPAREGPGGRREKDALVTRASNASSNKEETIIRKLFSFRSGKQT
ncbi:RILP-like protein 2 isoform X2 [Globicephala melas]|uniref:RILP-like protein 2 isoform X2 n=1 Tax=Globicephala melas TaxID=9731 RepID=UPI003873A24A